MAKSYRSKTTTYSLIEDAPNRLLDECLDSVPAGTVSLSLPATTIRAASPGLPLLRENRAGAAPPIRHPSMADGGRRIMRSIRAAYGDGAASARARAPPAWIGSPR